jgi:predicted AAA+ superfamily ATPase
LKNQNIKIGTDMVLEYLSYGTKVYLLNQIKSLEPTTKKYFEIYNKYYI